MSIRFRCSFCQEPITRSTPGTFIACPECGASQVVPAVSDSSLAALPLPPAVLTDPAPAPPAASSTDPAAAPPAASSTAPVAPEPADLLPPPPPDPLPEPIPEIEPLPPSEAHGASHRWLVTVAAGLAL